MQFGVPLLWYIQNYMHIAKCQQLQKTPSTFHDGGLLGTIVLTLVRNCYVYTTGGFPVLP